MKDRARLVAPARVGSVIEAQQQAFAMLGHAEMTRMETIMLAAGWSTALVLVRRRR